MDYSTETRVMALQGGTWIDAGTMGKWFADDFGRIEVGPATGEDCDKGAYSVASVDLDGSKIGELRDTAAGVTYYVLD